ncbi:hypothetical protein [Rhodohalobacter sp. 8-1]|uniref:hypothetical protein n=1 Tax=Rhodohalobacter sp. 8-1 TaxID=3131972 RepID=UPI0030EB5D3F
MELPVTLKWRFADHAEVYRLEVAADDEFLMIVAEADSIPETTFEVIKHEVGSPYYRLVCSHGNGETNSWSAVWSFEVGTVTSNQPKDEIPRVAALLQNYPNPFNPATMIPYDLPTSAHVKVEIYDMLERNLVTLVDGMMRGEATRFSFMPATSPAASTWSNSNKVLLQHFGN